MNKETYILKIKDKTYVTGVKYKDTDTVAFQYVKTYFNRKLGIDLYEECLKIFNAKEICPFCSKQSAYVINYTIDNFIITINGIALHQFKGKNSYHCKRGKKSNCSGSFLNPNSIAFISGSLKISKEEANVLLLETNKSPFYHTNFDSSEDYKLSQTRDLNWYIKKYGEKRGNELYDKRIKLHSDSTSYIGLCKKYGEDIAKEICAKKASLTLKSHIKKHGEEKGIETYKNHLSKVKTSLESFILRHGEEKGTEKYESFIQKRSFRNTLDYFLEKYNENGLKEYNKWIKSISFTKKQYIEKYGEDAWIKKMDQNKTWYSKESITAFDMLLQKISNYFTCESIKYKETEYFLYDKIKSKIYYYDLYFKINDDKYIIEYDTPFCHPNKNYMTIDEFNNWTFPWNSTLTPDDKEKFDIEKRNFATSKNIKVFNFYVKQKTDVTDNIDLILNYLTNKYEVSKH